jgi:signal transduction histidine kinase
MSKATKKRDPGAPAPQVRFDPAKLVLLVNASKALASTTDLDQLLAVIVGEVQNVLNCEGAGVLLYDRDRDDFYWRTVRDRESFLSSAQEEIRIPKDRGVCGWVFSSGEPALVNDALNDPRVYREVDTKSGFITRTMVCVPLQTRETRLGVLYALNKVNGLFTDEDVEIMVALSSNVALALENASYYESLINSHKELERLNRVKSKMLNHLSHELGTPLAIVEASLRILQRRLEASETTDNQSAFDRIMRNIGRLKTIERQVSHIVEEKEYEEGQTISSLLNYIEDLIGIEEEEQPQLREALESLSNKIEEYFPSKREETERISIAAAFQAVEFRVKQMTEDRSLDVRFVPPDPAVIKIQPQIMLAVIGGLVRNAVENTPDHGRIVITGERWPAGYKITVRDYGVGVPESEQPNIFQGFYPVQETDFYSSGRRYAFNAGGTGTDLLKIKIFSERLGFHIRFNSQRCSCIPTAADACPGDIIKCSPCSDIEDCYNNGGTEFVVEFPPNLIEAEGTQAE